MSNKNKDLIISEQYLKEVLDHRGSSLVGKILKRFEILEDKNAIKATMKELIYEEFRQLKEIMVAFDSGREMTVFKFKSRKPQQ